MRLSQTKARKKEEGEEEKPEVRIHDERVRRGIERGVVVPNVAKQKNQTAGEEDGYEGLVVSSEILKSDGLDLVMKGNTRRAHRYLLVFPGLMSLADGATGRLGTLSNLSTPNPTMVIDFGEKGQVTLLGTIVHTSTQYALLNLESKKSVVIEEVFDSLIVFSDAVWLDGEGKAADVKAVAGSGPDTKPVPVRSGCTTGVPKTVRVKRRSKPAAETFADPLPRLAGSLDDLESLESMELDTLDGGEDDDSDDSFTVGAKRKGRKEAKGGPPARAVQPRQKRKTAVTKKEVESEEEDEEEDERSEENFSDDDWSGGD
ncbi:hypothetical protein HOP50_01g09170 [Chloropicon primus]|uniref:Uncharacterized protein n=1 Tax=Chloropicon primus TaxID=1764295 RepID=A0A5B8MGE7_9CHLO|nr:hypothetical protein A3770_01p09300 [Chloropicon primus]UPQ97622.1 hypothetical protein HOP50_01g09170 [Chloropicon primus]|mmetsp:Transcript_4258/g.12475  ORF Transcript_4258/g.12475 Transcript_4258/m.12475 type:complete len:316 (+) Transcript_4258:342-1289(+)|eukprot:QDZ18412.1 hypothetical protein A3770_01p09300 [Chloropicon primus]